MFKILQTEESNLRDKLLNIVTVLHILLYLREVRKILKKVALTVFTMYHCFFIA